MTDNTRTTCCRFIKKDYRVRGTKLMVLMDEDTLTRTLYRCQCCGRLYLEEYYEVDMYCGTSEDKYYSLQIAVADEEDARQLARLSPLEMLSECTKRDSIMW